MVWGWRTWRVSGPPERVARASSALLVVRVGEGLAAWLLFNEFFVSTEWLVQAAFVAYLLLNLGVALRYRRGLVSWSTIGFDVTVNALTLFPAIVSSGGLASPLLLLLPLKAIHYLLIFGDAVATLFVLVNVVMLGGIAWTDSALLLPLVSGSVLTTQTTQRAMQLALVGFLVGAPLSTAWLRRVVAVDRLPTRRREPSRADADGTPAAVANALLTVSEVVSRLTRLDEILETVVEIAPRSVEVDYCGIALWAEDTGTYTGAVASGGTTIDERFAGLQLAP